MRPLPLSFLLLALVPMAAHAQQRPGPGAAAADTIFLRAQRLVNSGEAAAGRKLVDSVLGATPASSPRLPEALFWRASLAATSAEAERDYRRLAIEFPLSRRAEDALVRLAQLEMARGDHARAEKHLERLLLEHPGSSSRARWQYWIARARFDANDVPSACAALADARARAELREVELINQIDYSLRRCPAGAANAPAAATATRTPVESTPSANPPVAPTSTTSTPPVATAVPAPATPAPRSETTDRRSSVEYTVQVTAYESRRMAEQLRDRLRGRGFDARVVDAGVMFRVRVGRYPTRAAAAAIAAKLKEQGTATWVTEAEAP